MKVAELHTKELERTCEKVGVKKLYVFGSVSNGTSTEISDIDFLVEFQSEGYEGAFDQFMGLKKRLTEIYGKQVDLLTMKKFRNPVFRDEVEASKFLIYGS